MRRSLTGCCLITKSTIQLKEYVKQLNKFYLDHRELWQIDYSWEGFSWIANDDNAGSTIAFMRRDEDENYIISICRFIKNDAEEYRIGVPESGSYKVVFNSDEKMFGGKGYFKKKTVRAEKYPCTALNSPFLFPLPATALSSLSV